MAAIVGYQADLFMASGASVTFTQEAVADTGDHQTYRQTGTPAHRYWDDKSALTIEFSVNGGANWNPASNFTVDYVGGVVTFTTIDAARLVRASGKYFAISQIGQAYNWELNPQADVLDFTTFSSTGWRAKTVGIHEATGKASAYYLDGTFFALLGGRLVIVFYTDFGVGSRFEAYAYLKSDPLKSAVDALVNEDLEFEVDGRLYYRAS